MRGWAARRVAGLGEPWQPIWVRSSRRDAQMFWMEFGRIWSLESNASQMASLGAFGRVPSIRCGRFLTSDLPDWAGATRLRGQCW